MSGKAKRDLFVNGEYYTRKELAEKTGMEYHALVRRLKMTPQEAYDMGSTKNKKKLLVNRQYCTLVEFARKMGLGYGTLRYRLKKMTAQEIYNKEQQ